MRTWDPEESWETKPKKKGVFEKMLNLLGVESEEVVEEIYPAEEEVAATATERDPSKVVALQQGQKPVKLVVVEPTTFDEVQGIVDHLKHRRPVIINMEDLDKVMARRITDFVSGAAYALEGAVQKVSGSILLFTPAGVEVTLPLRSELKTETVPEFKFNTKDERKGFSSERPFSR
ncbi:MAG TPA: cell division protein SepF [Firmicutes bacterium]|nr:cell division protein SepF [Bacillota bacterium]HOQ23369.1 cell division protein SepF [Bacillota bacterium]HPT66787.1 cell division protein SepF [Bacillota bacterium]